MIIKSAPKPNGDYIEVGYYRIYYTPNSEGNGFEAKVYELNQCSFDDSKNNNCWNSDESTFSILFEVIAYFDGIRHLHVSDEGYIYYPAGLIKVFEGLNSLCEKYCLKESWDKL